MELLAAMGKRSTNSACTGRWSIQLFQARFFLGSGIKILHKCEALICLNPGIPSAATRIPTELTWVELEGLKVVTFGTLRMVLMDLFGHRVVYAAVFRVHCHPLPEISKPTNPLAPDRSL